MIERPTVCIVNFESFILFIQLFANGHAIILRGAKNRATFLSVELQACALISRRELLAANMMPAKERFLAALGMTILVS